MTPIAWLRVNAHRLPREPFTLSGYYCGMVPIHDPAAMLGLLIGEFSAGQVGPSSVCSSRKLRLFACA